MMVANYFANWVIPGGIVPDKREAHALIYFVVTATGMIQRLRKEVVYTDAPLSIRQQRQAGDAHTRLVYLLDAAKQVYDVTAEQMFQTGLVAAVKIELNKRGGIMLPELDRWIQSGGNPYHSSEIGDDWFKASE